MVNEKAVADKRQLNSQASTRVGQTGKHKGVTHSHLFHDWRSLAILKRCQSGTGGEEYQTVGSSVVAVALVSSLA